MSTTERTSPQPHDRGPRALREDVDTRHGDARASAGTPDGPAAERRYQEGPADVDPRRRDDDNGLGLGVGHDVDAERERFGGVKVGAAFFGWLTAMGMAVVLTALVAAAGTAVALATGTTVDTAAADASSDPTTVGIVGIAALLVILFVAYYCGGYVAGRMARFDGAKQGVGVWVWALAVAVLVAVLGAVAGTRFNVLADLNSFPRIPLGEGDLTTAGIIAAVVAAVAALVGAILGGLAGMRFHRRVDRATYEDVPA